MKTKLFLLLAAVTVLAGCLNQDNPAATGELAAGIEQIQADIETLKAGQESLKTGQEAIVKELAEVKKVVTPKKREVVSDVNVELDISNDPSKGDRGAALALVEFTDYECPFCARHIKGVLPQFLKDYVETGKVRYVIRDFPLPFHKNAKGAAYAAHCAGEQEKYWEMHDVLFANQKALAADQLPGYAEKLGLDAAAFEDCMNSGRYESKVTASLADGKKATVRGTPSFVIGVAQDDGNRVKGTKVIRGAVGYDVFKKTLDDMLKPVKGADAE
jgi:protein-disulfide isomerase